MFLLSDVKTFGPRKRTRIRDTALRGTQGRTGRSRRRESRARDICAAPVVCLSYGTLLHRSDVHFHTKIFSSPFSLAVFSARVAKRAAKGALLGSGPRCLPGAPSGATARSGTREKAPLKRNGFRVVGCTRRKASQLRLAVKCD